MRYGRIFPAWNTIVGTVACSLTVTLLLLLSDATAGRPQAPQTGSAPLASVQVTGSGRFSSEQIVAATGLRTGASVDRQDLQAAADRLAKLGLFARVQYRYTTAAPGVEVEYQVTDAPEIPIVFDNFPWFTDQEIIAAIKKSVPLFDGMAPSGGTILDDISSALEKLLNTQNVHAPVSHLLTIRGAASEKVQQFSVDGVDLNVGRVEFSDALANGDHGIQDQLSNLAGKPFSRSAIELFELEQVRPLYFSHGYLRVQFGEPRSHLADTSKVFLPGQLIVVAPIDSGPTYTWNGVTWKGDYAIPPDALDALVKLRTGDVADGTRIEGVWQAVRDLYGERGYLDAKVDVVPAFDDATKRVSYAVSIDEGPQYHMGSLVLTGLSLDGERRIRASWKIAPGAVFDKNIYDDFLDVGITQAFAGLPYHYDKIGRFLQKDAKNSKVDVLLDFQ
jgi:outer membrane protein assembly factor BamA